MEAVVKIRVRESTYDSYKYHLEHYLFPLIGKFAVTSLKTIQIQKACNLLRERHSPRTVQYVHTILKNALKKAVETRLIHENPCAFVELPKMVKGRIKVFSPEEAQSFLEAASKDPRGLIFEFALLTGARPEEYLAVKWGDLDWVTKTVTFRRTVVWKKGGGFTLADDMKTVLSRRTIPLPNELTTKLRDHRSKQAEQMLRVGPSYDRNDLVFANEIGKPLHYGNLTKRSFFPILKAAGLGHHRLYSLRHSCATLLLSRGENIKVIQERLGHSDVTLTLSTYSHVLEGMQAQATGKLSEIFYKRAG